jgi:hypothetical protein
MGLAHALRQLWAMNCTACKRLILALALAAEDGVGGFS